MSDRNRRFFSAPTLERAVLEAAAYLDIPAADVRYAEVEKRGLSRSRGVTIRIDRVAEAPPAEESVPTEAAAAEVPEPQSAEGPAIEGNEPEVHAAVEEDSEDLPSTELPSPPQPEAEDRSELVAAAEEETDSVEEPPAPAQLEEEADEALPSARPTLPRGQRIELPSGPHALAVGENGSENEVTIAAARWVEAVLDLADLDTEARVEQRGEVVWIDLAGPDEDLLLEDSGQLLQSIQHLMPRLMQSDLGRVVTCVADSGGFREFHAERLRVQAVQAAETVRREGRALALEPMNPPDRREVHMALADDAAVDTESSGRGYFKRITVRPA
jgi:spoIIIJ-associated protein